jgi:CxxC motif-containing protein (DUF1111 family)
MTGFIAALLLAMVALVAMAQVAPVDRPTYWPPIDPKRPNPQLTEWYSDVPWHQKLGTYAANEIVTPMIFPYEVLPSEAVTYCNGLNMSQEDCMIETGVANILGYHRFDTFYDPDNDKIMNAGCKASSQCIEVRLEISNYRARVTGSSVTLEPEVIGKYVDQPVYGGFYITDGSTYAQQVLWEMSHYCDSTWPSDMQDPVCYGDYFSPMNDGFHWLAMTNAADWPRSAPWSVYPSGDPPEPSNQCKPGDKKCVMALAGFNMGRVPKSDTALQYNRYNSLMMQWFNNALVAFPKELGQAEIQRHFPWSGIPVTWESFVFPLAERNPLLGAYVPTQNQTAPAVQDPTCDAGLDGPVWHSPPVPAPPSAHCTDAPHYQAAGYAYPRFCTLDDLAGAAGGDITSSDKLRSCGLNYEIHPNGWIAQWPKTPIDYQAIVTVKPFNYDSNQYGRTSFIFGGVPGMQMPVSFYRNPASGSGLSVYEQVHNASIFSLYLPAANIADVKRAMQGRNYGDTGFYHTLLMSNHMESDPEQFADGIRGKVLWHNEYRMEPMYEAHDTYSWLKDRTFQAAFDPLVSKYDSSKAPAPFHNHTCDGCHVRNGSGVPINTSGKLDKVLQEFMADNEYVPYPNGHLPKDYTFTGEIRPMKLVFFDLQPNMARLVTTSHYSEPLNAAAVTLANAPRTVGPNDFYYNNKVMNFYGDSFHVTPKGATTVFDYTWWYEDADKSRVVVSADRINKELGKKYEPQQIHLEAFTTPQTDCQIVLPSPTTKPWPQSCDDINSGAILNATKGNEKAAAGAVVGYILLNGKRLGNLSAIESIPNASIMAFQSDQMAKLGPGIAGEIVWAPGSRDGVKGKVKKNCITKSTTDCYIGRFGWLGDRASLEDQVANAAFVEMNMLTTEGYQYLYHDSKVANPIRYNAPNCGAANKQCVESTKGNSDLSERDVERMADYARWLGNPTRSEIQVSQPDVMAGEALFKKLQCDTCHVIKRIDIVPTEGTMLPDYFRTRVGTHISTNNKPFLSYIGTDLLMHDMGYLSQVGNASQSFRDDNGVVKPGYETFVQKVRTPPLKGLRFNNYVTDAHRNTKVAGQPGCDFLLHDGRACDAIEAAFLHDGPAIKKLKTIEGLGNLQPTEVMQLRAFLYSL